MYFVGLTKKSVYVCVCVCVCIYYIILYYIYIYIYIHTHTRARAHALRSNILKNGHLKERRNGVKKLCSEGISLLDGYWTELAQGCIEW